MFVYPLEQTGELDSNVEELQFKGGRDGRSHSFSALYIRKALCFAFLGRGQLKRVTPRQTTA